MSKFNVGDWWSIEEFDGTQVEAIQTAIRHLTKDGFELEGYLERRDINNLCSWKCIGLRRHNSTITVFDRMTDYGFDVDKKLSWSEFKESPSLRVGDKVMLSPESRWVGSRSDQPNSTNPTGVVGEIVREHADAHEEDTEFHWIVEWSNGTSNSYHSDDLILVESVYVESETNPHAIIEEQAAHIESLEQALEMVTKELIELRGEVKTSVNTEETFKPISEMTMEDWERALAEGWQFELRGVAYPVVVVEVDRSSLTTYPVRLSYASHGIWLTLQGYEWCNSTDRCTEDKDVTKRIK